MNQITSPANIGHLVTESVLPHSEKVSAMRTEEYFEERARRANPTKVSRILARVGNGNPPVVGDELPANLALKKARRKK
jgi:hypothetical protein